jgi:hypothetical protein
MYWKQPSDFPSIIDYLLMVDNDTINLNNGGENFDIDAHSLAMANVNMGENFNYFVEVPTIKMELSKIREPKECPLRFMLYRGLRQNRYANRSGSGFYEFVYPFATSEDFCFIDDFDAKDDNDLNFNLTAIAAKIPIERRGKPVRHTLTWKGVNGIYNRFHRSTLATITQSKTITITIYLTLDKFLAFRFQDKVRIKNMEYLVKKLKGVLKAEGDLVEIQAELITTL